MTGHEQFWKLKTTFVDNSVIVLKTINEKKNMIPAIIADPYCREILRTTELVPKSAVEINVDTKIPISTVYRRIQILRDADLLETSGTISEEGKKFFLFKSSVKEVLVKFDGSLHVKIIPTS